MAQQEEMHRCGHVVRVVGTRKRKVRCLRPGAQPMFTRSVIEVGPRYPQPRWFCNVHWSKHKEVWFDGASQENRPFPGTLLHRIKLKVVAQWGG